MRRRMIQGFQTEMIEQEGQVKGWIAVPCHFAVDDDQPIAADQQIFGAVIAMHERRAALG